MNEETRRAALAAENGVEMNKAGAFTEIYLWNLNMDRLIRVRQRLELHSIRSKRELKAYEIRLEEIRAGLNRLRLQTRFLPRLAGIRLNSSSMHPPHTPHMKDSPLTL